MAKRYRKKPLASFEHGTRIYAPSASEHYYRIIATDPLTGKRVYLTATTEAGARDRARELEDRVAHAAELRQPDDGDRTVGRLADLYLEKHIAHRSTRYRERQEYLLRRWVRPLLAERPVKEWTPADSEDVLNKVRSATDAASTVQSVGATMRGMVTYARKLRWLTARDDDPMWMVSYSAKAKVQGESVVFIPRESLPTDADCEKLFAAMAEQGDERWATAMRLTHRSGLRWGELTALRAGDIQFEPTRIVRVSKAVERPSKGAAKVKAPKNLQARTTIFPRSLTDELRALVDQVMEAEGPAGLLFPGARGGLARRSSFQQVWIKAAAAAGWPMVRPLARTKGYGPKGKKGWRYVGSARWTVHDLRHVAACWMLFDLKLDAAIVADKLGHADASFTIKRYVGVRGDADEQATEATDEW
ncbi:MAG TPA: tyrosine-type recombinase/integrase [Ilumatobacter sp.]|nr:tyrosine-type recombinase/integrase [Ilumatobacter sp.]